MKNNSGGEITEGYYWAKAKGFQYHNCIVRIINIRPLQLLGYCFLSGAGVITSIYQLDEIGPRIEQP